MRFICSKMFELLGFSYSNVLLLDHTVCWILTFYKPPLLLLIAVEQNMCRQKLLSVYFPLAPVVKGCRVRGVNAHGVRDLSTSSLWYSCFRQHCAWIYTKNAEMDHGFFPAANPFFHQCHHDHRLAEMEGFAVWFSTGGLLIVSEWSPPATALIIHDPTCMLKGCKGGINNTACMCVWT